MSRLGVSLVCAQIEELGGWVEAIEEAGFDAIGFGDSPALYPETYVQATIVAQRSRRAMFGPRVTNPVTRHPSVTASAMAAVDRLGGGRAVLGIGLGDSAVHTVGTPRATIAELEAYVRALRELFQTGETTYRGSSMRCPYALRPVPIYISASGPRGLALAGELADGVIVGVGVLPELVETALGHIDAGARRAGRSLEDLDIWWLMGAGIGPSRTDAVESIKTHLAAAANAAFRGAWQGKGVPPELEPALRDLVEGYDFGEHELPGAGRRNVSAIEDAELTEYLAQRFAVAGTATEFAEHVRRAASWGADQLWLTMPLPDKYGFLAEVRDTVQPLLGRSDAIGTGGAL
jgi:5,10-methylenetetrahydromethanopterin reductase